MPSMVDISDKERSHRKATAVGYLVIQPEALQALKQQQTDKGNPWVVAHLGATHGAKTTASMLSLCHPISLDHIEVLHHLDDYNLKAWIQVSVSSFGKTGVEMEALSGVSLGLLNLYDMLKSLGFALYIGEIHLLHKSGGKSGTFSKTLENCPWKP